MPKERKPFSLLGQTKWEKARNIIGLVIVIGFVASKYVNVNVNRISTVEIASADYGFQSSEALQDAVRSFRVSDAALVSASAAAQSTAQEVKENVTVTFAIGKVAPFSLVIECTSNWATEKVGQICESIGSDFKSHLRSVKQ